MTLGRARGAARGAAWSLVAVALLARVAFALATPHYSPRLDDRDYLRLGGAIAQSGAYPTPRVWVTRRGCPELHGLPAVPCVAAPGAPGAVLVARPTAYRPPAYPYVLAAPELLARWVGGNALDFARAFQVLLGVLDVVLVGLLARMLWGTRVALIALGLAAIYLPFVIVSGTLISEPLYVALMLGALCAVLHRRTGGASGWLLVGGVLAGASALTRSNGVIVPVAVSVLALGDRWGARGSTNHPGALRSRLGRLSGAAVVLACALLTVTPWMIRNVVVLGRVVPISTESGGTLVGTYNPTSRANRAEPAAWLGLSHIARYRVLYREQRAHPETAIDGALRRDALSFAAAHPLYVAEVAWRNTLRLGDLDGFARVRFTAASIDLPGGSAVAGAIVFYLVALLAVAGALSPAARRAPRRLWLLPALQFLTTVVVIAETPRFRTPLDPFILLLAALGVERLTHRHAASERL